MSDAPAATLPLKTFLVWLALCAIWGSTWLAIKVGLGDLPPFWFAGGRFVIAAAVLFAGCAMLRMPLLPAGKNVWRFLVLTGLQTFTVNYGLLFWGEQYISSGLAAVLQATIPAFGLFIAHFYLPAERLAVPKVLGALLGFFGVSIIFSHELHGAGPMALWGGAAIVLGAASVAYANVVIKVHGAQISPAIMAGWQMVFGLGPLLVLGAWREGNPARFHWSPTALLCLFYLALIGSSLAFVLSYWLVRQVAVTKSMTIALVTPIVAVALGWLVLDETLSWRTLAGAGLVLAGVGLIVRRNGAETPRPVAAALEATEEKIGVR